MTRQRDTERTGLNTYLAHGPYDPFDTHGFVNPPVVRGSTVLFPDTASLKDRRRAAYSYGLAGTPTTKVLEATLSDLENAAGTVLVPSGLAAISVPLLAFLSAGDHCLIVDSVYTPTRSFANGVLTRLGVEVEYFDPHVGADIAGLIRPQTKVVFMEAPGSNTFEIMDVEAVAKAAREAGAVTMLDNTWATPIHFRPLDHGVDLSIHALTKYPGGHSDLLMGSVSANAATFAKLRETQMLLGVNAAPDDVSLVLRGLKTMGVRLDRVAATSLALAEWLETRDEVTRVLHPRLASFPGKALFDRQFGGTSGLFSMVLKTDPVGAARFLDALDLFGLGFSWGGHESLAVPVDLSDRTIAHGPRDGTIVRLQIGLEDLDDLRADLEKGFTALTGG